MTPSLPKWRPRRTLIDLYNEKDQTQWYWRAAATVSAFLIMIGFLIFPSAFEPNSSLIVSTQTSVISALVLLILGYIISLTTAFFCTSWMFRLDILFVPCLTSSLFGLINTLYSLSIHSDTPQWTGSSIAALTLSLISTIAYIIAALLTFRKIYIVRARDAMHRHQPDSSAEPMMPETELQRQQLLRLLLQQHDDQKASPDLGQQTFKIDWPGNNAERRSTLGTLRNWRASRNGGENMNNTSTHGAQDQISQRPAYMEPVAEESTLDHGIAPLDARAYVPSNNHDSRNVLGGLNFRSFDLAQSQDPPPPQNMPQLQANGYPVEKVHAHYMDEQPRHQRNQYRMIDDNEVLRSSSNASAQERENRRVEIELADRGSDLAGTREDFDRVEVVGSIKRVETNGWGRR